MISRTYFLHEPYSIARICEVASFRNFVEMGSIIKLIQTWMMVLEVSRQREHSRPRQETGSTFLGAIPEGIVIGPVLQFFMVKIMKFFHRVIQNDILGLCFAEEGIA